MNKLAEVKPEVYQVYQAESSQSQRKDSIWQCRINYTWLKSP